MFDFLKNWFGPKTPALPFAERTFGRYSDYKSEVQRAAWDRARKAFEGQQYIESYRAFFEYLADPEHERVKTKEADGTVMFSFQQGSRKVSGYCDKDMFKAETRIAQTDTLHVGIMRRLVEQNYHLEYCRYALSEDGEICLVFNTTSADASPYKIFYALKELAIHADKQDDLLYEEFESLRPTRQGQIVPISDTEKEVKFQFMQAEIARVAGIVEKQPIDMERYGAGYSFLLLYTAYRIDYLIRPEGFTMETIERINRMYFTRDNRTIAQKNQEILRELKLIAARKKEDFFRELYGVKHTFGITIPENHERLASLIDVELRQMDWYAANGFTDFALAVPGFLVTHALFQFALPRPEIDFLELYMCITEAAFLQALGYQIPHVDANGAPAEKDIRRAVKRIVDVRKKAHPNLKPDMSQLDFSSMTAFSKSYLLMIRDLNFR